MRHTSLYKSILLCLLLSFLGTHSLSADKRHDRINALTDSCRACISEQRFSSSLKFARELLEIADNLKPGTAQLTALAYAGQSYMAADIYDSAGIILNKGLETWHDIENNQPRDKDWMPVYIIHNSLGVYYITYRMDYKKAIEIFTSGLELIGEHSHGDEFGIMGYNLMMAFFIRQDTLGLKYARTLYNEGRKSPESQLYFIGTYGLAKMLYLKGCLDEADYYLQKAMNSPYCNMDMVGLHTLRANILAASGKNEDAMAEFQEAFRHLNNDVQATNTSYLYLSYGDILSSRHEYKDAVRIYKEGLSIAGKKGNKVFTHNLYKSVSSAYEKLNDYDSSLLFYKMYHSVSDSLFNIKDERAIRELTLMYENTKHEAELHARTKSVHLMAILTVSILIIAIILWRMYRYKEHMYTILAKKYSEIVKRDNYRGNEEQSNRLFREIETLMREKHIYRESNLTREKAASMLGTNRTYLSQCINRNTGKSFSQYVNGYRIKNALTLLSDPDDTTPVKAVAIDSGFCSFSTFNTAFKEEIGMPPSVYREKIRQLAKNRLKEDSETAI